jgi:hypothetical protein
VSEDNYKVQWSVSLPPAAQYAKGDMLNIRGESAEEVERLFDEITSGEFVDKATEVANLVRLAAGVSVSAQADTAADQQSVQSQPAQSQPQTSGQIHTCAHGKRTEYHGTNTRGAYTAYFCPLKKGDPAQCEPVWG